MRPHHHRQADRAGQGLAEEEGIGWQHLPEPPEDPYDGITWELFIKRGQSAMAADALQQPPDHWAAACSSNSAPRRQLAKEAEMARTMRASQAQRIRANKQPDTTPP
ncbi:hypothetical protein [Aeromonas molluscorum]|uniref:hypothetical protein n=1 Tax=Aeromonas molluscorum TaxID=271417 RepID=UPI003F1B75DA